MDTVFPCYVSADREFAADLAEFLNQGADVRVFLAEGLIREGEDLVAKAADGRMADVVIVILSADSVPPRWVRNTWEEAFITGPASEGVRIAFLLRGDCQYPAVLNREAFFADRRPLKRWLRTGERSRVSISAELEALASAIADRPGRATASLASKFVEQCGADFDHVFWLRCANRTLAQLAGELGSALGLTLEGEAPENARRIREICALKRLLLVLQNAEPAQVTEFEPGGRTSVLVTDSGAPEPAEDERAELAFRDALRQDWPLACKLARQRAGFLRKWSRFAETFEIMEQLYEAALAHGDRRVQEEAAREQIWILEHWDRYEDASRLRAQQPSLPGRQLQFAFPQG